MNGATSRSEESKKESPEKSKSKFEKILYLSAKHFCRVRYYKMPRKIIALGIRKFSCGNIVEKLTFIIHG